MPRPRHYRPRRFLCRHCNKKQVVTTGNKLGWHLYEWKCMQCGKSGTREEMICK